MTNVETKARHAEAPADFFPLLGVDHIEFYVGNAKQAALFYERGFGFLNVAHSGLETGARQVASYVMEQGGIRLVFSSAYAPDHAVARHAHVHGDGVGVIALAVPDAERAYREATRRGAEAAIEPVVEQDEHGVLRYSAVHGYGDTLFKFVDRSAYHGVFAPHYREVDRPSSKRHQGYRLAAVDHIVGNVELGAMDKWVDWFARTMGFGLYQHFDDKTIHTEYSALMSKVMADGSGKLKFPINEPADGRRKSQIEEYLEYYHGPGVQHIAFLARDIIQTVSRMRGSGIEFLGVPRTYYEALEQRVGKIDEPVDKLAELGVLVDRDEEGYLLQIFTRPVTDRPTVFFEVIERHGSRGFGVGNFKALFEAIERDQALRGNL